MKRVWKSLFSAVVCIAIILSTLAVSAFAAEENSTESTLSRLLRQPVYVKANEKAGVDGQINLSISLTDASAVLYLPGKAKTENLCFSWKDKELVLSKDGKDYKSGKAPVAPEGETVTYTLKKGLLSAPLTIKTYLGSKGIRSIFLDIDESLGIVLAMNLDSDHLTSCYGKVISEDVEKDMSVKGRGNSTWVAPKKSYNVTFYKDAKYDDKKKVELIDGVKAKKWSLQANYFDNTLMRNKIAMDLARNLGIGLDAAYADLWVNGEFYGNYTITPKKDSGCPDNGYIIENDHIPAEGEDIANQFEFPYMHNMPAKHNMINVDDVGDLAKEAGVTTASIEKDFKKAWKTVLDYDSDEYMNYFDVDSFAKMYLMFEVSKTYDCYAGNIIMRREGLKKTDKYYCGPAWDYDIAFGRTLHKFIVGVSIPVQMNAEGWYNDSVGYLITGDEPVSMLQELGKHKSFMLRVANLYNEYKWAFEDLSANVTRSQKQIRKSAIMNNNLWDVNHPGAMYLVAPNTMAALGTGKYKLNYEVTLSWSNYVNNLKEFCDKRVMWLSDHLAPGATIETLHGGTVQT
ncbi:MAG: CotH kinase family protein [Clostridia bacterium]|nr:CotH kinase family protein [Clostridia bacterium]